MSVFSVDNAFAHRHGYNEYGNSTDTERTQNVDTLFVQRRKANAGAQPGAQPGTQPRSQPPDPPWGNCMGLCFYLY